MDTAAQRNQPEERTDSADASGDSPPYHGVAAIYDTLMAEVFSARQRPLIDETIRYLNLRPGVWADVACGTGTVACHLAADGWRAYGSDISDSMLEVARRKASERALAVSFRREDMRRLSPPCPCDVVSCLFDSINILTRRYDLVQAFRAAARALKPGGYYLFDAVTPHQTSHLWDYCDPLHEGPGFLGAWSIKDRPDPFHTISVTMRWFTRREDGLYERFDETHRVRGYSRRDIAEALRQAGLKLVRAYEGDAGFLAPVRRSSMRIDYIARAEE
jgi:ubiquinone/menaquinone biosynthesis C-methylase UbiE